MTVVQSVRPVEGLRESVVTALTGFVAVLYRRAPQDRVAVACHAGWGASGVVEVDLAGDPTFAALRVQLRDRLGCLADGAAPDPTGVAGSAYLAGADGAPDGGFPAGSFPAAEDAVFAVAGVEDPAEVAVAEAAVRAAVASGAGDSEQPVSLLDLAPAGAADRLRALGHSERRPPPARGVPELIAERVAAAPDAPALTRGAEVLTYRQLDARASRAAEGLRAAGARPGGVVAILQQRSPDLVVTLLAVLKAGAAYLALEPDDPPARHVQLVRDAGADLVVVEDGLRERAPAGARAVALAELTSAGTAAPAGAPAVAVHPDDLAYVSYTSGSTGEPRGVAVTHRAISRLVRDPNWIDIRPDDVFLLLAPVAFDASTLEIWVPLVNGCRLAVAPDGALDLDQIAGTLQDEGVTVLWLTAGLFHMMVAARLDAFAGVRHLVAGGDVISPDHLARLLGKYPELTFTNGYGPTENTTFTACWTTATVPDAATVPIGRPIVGTHVAVLDAALRPVPQGVCGELYAAGDGLARGYVNRPGATADRFVPDTFSGEPGARMYRTGDLAKWTVDGTVEFLGRADQQVKVQGFRVEPGSIEAELTRLPEVREAVVVAQRDEEGGKRLLAYVVLTEPDGPGAQDAGARIREKLLTALPAYMVPLAVLVRPELPLNRNGKVDRWALPAASRVPRNVWNEFVPPRTPAEQRLADLWGEVLKVEPIGVEDDFFDLGGHSLLVAELLGTLKDVFDVDVPARVLYLQPTIAELAQELGK